MTLNTVTINFSDALKMLVSIVQEFGKDYTPASPDGGAACIYVERNETTNAWGDVRYTIDTLNLKPVCIVGQVFARLGIARALIRPSGEDQYGACALNEPMWANAVTMGVTFTEEAKTLLRNAQSEQDRAVPWGDAVKEALSCAQETFLADFKTQHPAFGYAVDDQKVALDAATSEPLAEWERELLED